MNPYIENTLFLTIFLTSSLRDGLSGSTPMRRLVNGLFDLPILFNSLFAKLIRNCFSLFLDGDGNGADDITNQGWEIFVGSCNFY